MFKHILIPTDGSALSKKTLKRALGLAKTFKAKVTVVYVFSPYVVGFYGEMGLGWETVEQQMREFGKREAF